MSKAYVLNQLKHGGTASIVATVKPHCRTHEHLARLEQHFRDRRDLGDAGPNMLYLEKLGVIVGEVDREGWDKLQKSAALSEVTGPPPLRPVTGLGSDAPLETAPKVSWGLERIGVPALWAKGLSGEGVLVAHLDTGVDGTHPALKDAIEAFSELNANGQPVEGTPVADSSDHGTHTAGTIAGRPGGAFTIGVAPGCRLVSAAVIEGGDPVKRILAGVNWALSFPIKVLNLSAGFEGHFDQYAPLLDTVRAHGVLPIFAAGNFGPNTSCAPANYPQAMAVGAIDADGEVDADSSSQRLRRRVDPQVPDLAMPGVDIISANAGGGFRADSGTSMAAPHAAGLAALLWEAFPKATPGQIEAAIYASCSRTGGMTESRAGRGLADGLKALAALEASFRTRPSRQAASAAPGSRSANSAGTR